MKIYNAEKREMGGMRAYLWHVIATVSTLMSGTSEVYSDYILSESFGDAAEMVKDELAKCGLVSVIEIHSRGPKGGRKYSSASYEQMVSRIMLNGTRKPLKVVDHNRSFESEVIS